MPVKKTKSPVVAGNKGDTSILSTKNGHDSKKPSPPTNGNHDPRPETLDQKELLRVLTEVRNGNFSARMPFDEVGLNGKICDTLNDIIALNEKMMREFTRAGNTIGKQGKLTQRIEIPMAKGSWNTGVESLNEL